MAENDQTHTFVINTQYLKDQSFENPNAPGVYAAMAQTQPELNISIDVSPAQLQDKTYEVVLTLHADAKIEGTPAFLAEIDYAGVVTLEDGIDEDETERLLMVETPRYLFPFARAILAVSTRDGGFPPLVVNPIDFAKLYQNRKDAAAAASEAEETSATETSAEQSPAEA